MKYIPSYFKLHVCWLRSITRITYKCKLIGTLSLAAFSQLELFRIWVFVLFPAGYKDKRKALRMHLIVTVKLKTIFFG
ncbi:hypothetical protein DXZ79_12265 [Yersinia rochesterensis]|uniref:Uncharacterized protein n=1 Tax=Yersinia rochesterensis TaxID=1604335 RepID=A0A8D4N605_9GAMM|nr:hypothetical protein DXZ79_12265 [Yersinia rochesterensis]